MKPMKRLLAGVAAASLVTSPLAAADFGYDMGLEHDAKTYGGLYYSIPFQGGTDRETREGTKLGFQLDYKNGGAAFGPFQSGTGLQNQAMFDVSFDSNFTLNKMLVNGMDTVALYDQLNATGGLGSPNMALFAGGIVLVAIIAASRDGNGEKGASNSCNEAPTKDDFDFTQVSFEPPEEPSSCEEPSKES